MESFCLKGEVLRRWREKKSIYNGNITITIINQNATNIGNYSHRDKQNRKKSELYHFRELIVGCISCLFKNQKIPHIMPLPGTILDRSLVLLIFLFNWQNQLRQIHTDPVLSKT